MNFPLPAADLRNIRQCISQTLTDSFQMMFRLDVFPLPSSGTTKERDNLCSYILLNSNAAKVTLSIAVDRPLAEFLAQQLCAPAAPEAHVAQDVVCEINNIVGNRVRSYIQDNMGMDLSIGLPKIGLPTKRLDAMGELRLFFRMREADQVNLEFLYAPALRRAQP